MTSNKTISLILGITPVSKKKLYGVYVVRLLNPFYYKSLPEYLVIDIREELSNLFNSGVYVEIPNFEIEHLQSLLDYAVMAEDNYDNLDSYLFDVLGNDLPVESLNPLLSLIYQFALRISDKLKNLGGYIRDKNQANGFFPYLVKNIKNGIVLYQKISSDEIEQFYTFCIPSN